MRKRKVSYKRKTRDHRRPKFHVTFLRVVDYIIVRLLFSSIFASANFYCSSS